MYNLCMSKKKILILFIIVVLIETLGLMFLYINPKEHLYAKKVNCTGKTVLFKYKNLCYPYFDDKYYNDEFLNIENIEPQIVKNEKGYIISKIFLNNSPNLNFAKRVVEYNYTEDGKNKISETVTDYDKNDKEIGRLELMYNLNHQVLSYWEFGSFGDNRYESFIDKTEKRALIIQFKGLSDKPTNFISFHYK